MNDLGQQYTPVIFDESAGKNTRNCLV